MAFLQTMLLSVEKTSGHHRAHALLRVWKKRSSSCPGRQAGVTTVNSYLRVKPKQEGICQVTPFTAGKRLDLTAFVEKEVQRKLSTSKGTAFLVFGPLKRQERGSYYFHLCWVKIQPWKVQSDKGRTESAPLFLSPACCHCFSKFFIRLFIKSKVKKKEAPWL